MKTFTLRLLFTGLALFLLQSLRAQKMLDPADTIVNYDSTHPPVQPAWGKIGKWVRTPAFPWSTSTYKCYIYQGSDFRLRFPQTYQPNDGKKYPIMVFYHGDGESGPIYDNERPLRNGMAYFDACEVHGYFDGFIIVMQNQYGWGTAQFQNLNNLIDTLVQEYGGDPYRVIQNGLSGGGQGIWNHIGMTPSYFATAIPMSAALTQDQNPAVINILKFTPIWNLDGGLDSNPAPYTAQQVADAFFRQGANYTFKIFPSLGHNTWDSTWHQPNFWPYVNSAYLSNPWPLFGQTMVCPGQPIKITIGIVPGLDGYQWRRNDTIIAGAIGDSIVVTQPGTYDARVLRGQYWSDWSHIPVVISSGLPPLNFAVTQPTCTVATGKITVSGPTRDTLYYSIDGQNYSTKGEFDSLAPGIYHVSVKNSFCSVTTFADTIQPQPLTPNRPLITVTQPSCTTPNGMGAFVISVQDTSFRYSINNGKNYNTYTKFSGIPEGNYLITARSPDGCVSSPKDTVHIGPPVAVPAKLKVTVTQPSCINPAGSILIDTTIADTGLVYSINGSSYTSKISYPGLAAGTYPVTAKNTDGCASPADTVVIVTGKVTPSAPTLSISQPTCAVTTGTITITAPVDQGSNSLAYSINGSTYQDSTVFANLASGKYAVTVKNLGGCVSSATQAVINKQPTAPKAPDLDITQPTCATGSGTITISAPETGLSYSIDGTNYQETATFNNLAAGNYKVTAENGPGCVSPSSNAVINPVPGLPPAPTVLINQPTCTVGTGSITVTSPIDSGYTYRLSDTTSFQPVPLFPGLPPGTYHVAAKGGPNGCISSPATAIVKPSPALPAPTLAVTQATCWVNTGAITVTSPVDTGLVYSLNGSTYQSDTVISPVSPGTYQITVKNTAGCVSTSSSAQILPPPTSCSSCVAAAHTPFDGFRLSANPGAATTLWFNLHTKIAPDQLTANGDYLLFSGGTLVFSGINSSADSAIALPDGEIIADNTVISPSTSFNSTRNIWITKVPVGYQSDDVFVTGAAINSNNGYTLSGNSNTTLLSGSWTSDKTFSSQWWYGLACYQPTFSTAEAGSVNVDDGTPISGHSAGTPNSQTGGLVSGGSGNGGSNYTGTYSSADDFSACVIPLQVPSKVDVTVYPNPYQNTVYFNITTSVSGTGTLEFYNLLGENLGIIEATQFQAGVPQTITATMTIAHKQAVVWVFRIGSKKVEGTLVPVK